MYFTKNKAPVILMALLLLILCLPVMAMAESAEIQEITVTNTPVKGRVQVQKQGPVLVGFNEHQDPFGYTVHTPMYNIGSLSSRRTKWPLCSPQRTARQRQNRCRWVITM